MGIIETGLELLYPSNIYCISCGSIIDKTRPYALCDECIEKFHWLGKKTCRKCGKILEESYRRDLCWDCRTYGHDFDRGYTCVQYGLYERGVLLDYKYKGKSYIGRKLGDVLYDRMRLEEEDFDLIAPVPMYGKKQAQRGFNQAAVMASRLAWRMGTPCVANLLIRRRRTLPMKGLGAFERQQNLEGAFAAAPGNHYKLEDRRILLVDDIYTTGSTMDACSRVLREAGAKEIHVLSFACGANKAPKQ
ncbi:ComF family protein [Eubacteriales bacterium DFI.9.88]|nr:ComF family protein [Eubacteriales bacterium DFI.9.88]